MSYLLFGRHAEFISASLTANYLDIGNKTLKQVQGDVLNMTICRHSKKIKNN